MKHPFIFQHGNWIGQGNVVLSVSPEKLIFYTKWEVRKEEAGFIFCLQTVELQGETERLENRLIFYDFEDDRFKIILENELVGHVEGQGVYNDKEIAWEYHSEQHFEGLEVYKLQENGEYLFHAEYISPELFRSTIDGKIWVRN